MAVSNGAGTALGIDRYDGSEAERAQRGQYGIPQATNLGRFGYTGQAWLPEIGMYYYKARIYSATLGRFLQADPLGYADGLNLYAYVGNDPINATDPSGMVSDELVVVGRRIRNDISTNFHIDLRDLDLLSPTGVSDGLSGNDPGDIVVTGRRPDGDGCPSPPISNAQRALADRGARYAFWQSRARSGDPLAATALSIVTNSPGLGFAANKRLRDAIMARSPSMPPVHVQMEMQRIGVAIMQAHIEAIDEFGSPNVDQIADYHGDVFQAYGLPRSTFGGTAMFGSAWVANMVTGWAGCR